MSMFALSGLSRKNRPSSLASYDGPSDTGYRPFGRRWVFKYPIPCATDRTSTIAMMAHAPNPVKERGIVVLLCLDKIRLDLFKSTTSLHIFPKYAVDHVRNRHLGSYFFVYQMNALACIVSFRDHIQFQLGRPDGVTLPDHVPKGPIPAEQRVTGNKKITQIDGGGIVVPDTHLPQKPGHFVGTIRDQYTEEIIPVLQSVSDAGPQGINILQDRSILYSIHIRIDHRIQVIRREIRRQF